MKNYVKPVVMANDGMAESVYMASGDGSFWTEGDCWTVSAKNVQDWNGSHTVYEVHAQHSTGLKHHSGCTIVKLTFSVDIVDAYSEFPTSVSGKTVTVTRSLLGDAYGSGDQFTYKVWVNAGSEAATKALEKTPEAVISCKHEYNVQGEID